MCLLGQSCFYHFLQSAPVTSGYTTYNGNSSVWITFSSVHWPCWFVHRVTTSLRLERTSEDLILSNPIPAQARVNYRRLSSTMPSQVWVSPRINNLFWKLVPVFDHLHSKKGFFASFLPSFFSSFLPSLLTCTSLSLSDLLQGSISASLLRVRSILLFRSLMKMLSSVGPNTSPSQ